MAGEFILIENDLQFGFIVVAADLDVLGTGYLPGFYGNVLSQTGGGIEVVSDNFDIDRVATHRTTAG